MEGISGCPQTKVHAQSRINWSKLLRALSSSVLDISEDGDFHVKLLLVLSGVLCTRCCLSCHWMPLRMVCLPCLYSLLTLSLLQMHIHIYKIPSNILLLRLNNTSSLQPFFVCQMLQSLNHSHIQIFILLVQITVLPFQKVGGGVWEAF